MEKHIRILGYLYMVFSALAFVFFLSLLLLLAGIMSFVSIHDGSVVPLFLTGGIGLAFMIIVTVATLPGFLAGYGLLNNKSWGRPLGIIMAILYLIEPPIGTALGIYALWVLLNEESKHSFDKA